MQRSGPEADPFHTAGDGCQDSRAMNISVCVRINV